MNKIYEYISEHGILARDAMIIDHFNTKFDTEKEALDRYNQNGRSGFIIRNEADHTYQDIDEKTGLPCTKYANKFTYIAGGPSILLKYIASHPQNKHGFHERIRGNQYQKFRLDIDALPDVFKAGFLDQIPSFIYNIMYKLYGIRINIEKDIVITTSSDATKISLHIILTNYIFVDWFNVKYVFDKLVDEYVPPEYKKYFDSQIYGEGAGLRLLYCSKAGSSRIKKLISKHTFADTLITHKDGCIVIKELEEVTERKAARIRNIEIEYDIENAKLRELIPPEIYIGFDPDFKRSENRLDFTRIEPSHCRICNREHENDHTLMIYITADGSLIETCRKALKEMKNRKEAYRLIHTSKEARNVNTEDIIKKIIERARCPIHDAIVNMPNIEIYSEKYMREISYKPGIQFIRGGTGTGKTHMLQKFINDHFKDKKMILAISARKTFTANMAARLGFESYLDKPSGPIYMTNPFICQFESLPRVNTDRKLDLLIIDESELVTAQMFSEKTNKNRIKATAMTKSFLQYADYVIVMDAYITKETINYFTRLSARKEYSISYNTFKSGAHADHYISLNKDEIDNVLFDALAAGKKIVIPVTSYTEAQVLNKTIKDKYPDVPTLLYTSDTTEEERNQDYADVNKSWRAGVLMYTPTVIAGISFDIEHFDLCICYWYANSAPADACLQMMHRVRHLKDNKYYHYIKREFGYAPETVKSLIARLQVDDEYLKDETNDIQFKYGESTNVFEIVLSEDFELTAMNLTKRARSKQHFPEVLCEGLITYCGADKVHAYKHEGAINEQLKCKLLAERKSTRAALMKDKIDVAIITDEEYNWRQEILFKNPNHKFTEAEHKEMKLYNFRVFYNYNGTFTQDLYKYLDNGEHKARYESLMFMMSREFKVGSKEISIAHEFHSNSKSHTFDYVKHVVQNSRRKTVLELMTQIGVTLRDPKDVFIMVDNLKQKFANMTKYMNQNSRAILTRFGLDKAPKWPAANDKDHFKLALEYINRLLRKELDHVYAPTERHGDKYILVAASPGGEMLAKMASILLEGRKVELEDISAYKSYYSNILKNVEPEKPDMRKKENKKKPVVAPPKVEQIVEDDDSDGDSDDDSDEEVDEDEYFKEFAKKHISVQRSLCHHRKMEGDIETYKKMKKILDKAEQEEAKIKIITPRNCTREEFQMLDKFEQIQYMNVSIMFDDNFARYEILKSWVQK